MARHQRPGAETLARKSRVTHSLFRFVLGRANLPKGKPQAACATIARTEKGQDGDARQDSPG
jgi:hypothetical protein